MRDCFCKKKLQVVQVFLTFLERIVQYALLRPF